MNDVVFIISKEDLALALGTSLENSELFLWQKFYYSEKGQRKLLTQASEGGQRVHPSLVLARLYMLLPDPLQ